ncbi:MAG: homocysteine S-methyltransferase family protein [Deltaproteobacteria bacterium]|nr:homocysteine S-methyltransferase family protein [Deltaproteobacteria bacterium]
MTIRDEKLLILDGACGSNIQAMGLPASVWDGREGCNEILNLTAPEAVVRLHESFLDAGAMVLETNTFGATSIVLAEYGLEGEVDRINRAAVAHARKAIAGKPRRYVAGSVGPTTKLPTLGHIGFAQMRDAYRAQVRALVESGVDLLLVETCQDLLQLKIALVACFEILSETHADAPVSVSVTMEPSGAMLLGSAMGAVAAVVKPFPVFSLGLNCATGPDRMRSHVVALSRLWPGRISCVPNAGIPEVEDGRTRYPLTPALFAAPLREFVAEHGVSLVGGCCGTTPAHIAALARALEGVVPAERAPEWKPCLASLYQAVDTAQEIPPLLVGERLNANGSKKFKEKLLADDYDGAIAIARDQESKGAHLLDLCCAYAGRDEKADMTAMVTRLVTAARAPLVIDSTNPLAIEAALERYPGRCLVNSVNLEDGGRTLDRVAALARKFGAALVALTIGPRGMAMTADDKLAVARDIFERATRKHGLAPEDLFFDALTFTLGSGDATMRRAAVETLAAIPRIKAAFPGARTILGVSNVSFGLPSAARPVLNSVFLHEAISAGLDAAIVDAGKILPLARIAPADRDICLDLVHDREREPGTTPLAAFLAHFAARKPKADDKGAAGETGPAEKALEERILSGDREDLDDLLHVLLERRRPLSIVNEILVPAMRRVGDLFGRGEMLLPFVLESAEVMRRAVAILEPHMDKGEMEAGTRILLATVQGDVHDIGKNLADIILSNNGYKVFNIGTNVPTETIIEKAKELRVDAIGLSGLLVKSALHMKESLPAFRAAGLGVPVLLGGAALTRRFVAEGCVPAYGGKVVYCPDAFAGLMAVQELESGALESTRAAPTGGGIVPDGRDAGIDHSIAPPSPPFLGARRVTGIDIAYVLPHLKEQALFRTRWGFKRAGLDPAEHEALIEKTARPALAAFVERCKAGGLVDLQVAYGWFRCRSDGDKVVIETASGDREIPFPRQEFAPGRCIADFFRSKAEGGDVAGFLLATVGPRLLEEAKRLFEAGSFKDYMMLHGFGAELAEALTEYWHGVMREEIGVGERGARYGFGYPACPDMAGNAVVAELVGASEIGVTLTSSFQLVPELSTSAIVALHPDAKYFAV